MIDRKPIAGKRLRVYGAGGAYRDFNAQRVDVAPDGSMLLTQVEQTGEEVDFKTGQKAMGYRQTLLAVIGPDGDLRLESIDVETPPPSGVD